MEAVKVEFSGISGAFPLIIFAYMYQVNVPALYSEMEKPDEAAFAGVLGCGSGVAVLFYLMVGVFGYAIFAAPEHMGELCSKNILDAASLEHSVPFKAGNFAILCSVLAAAPLCVLPTKDAVEELFYKGSRMTTGQNFLVTFGILVISGALGIAVPDIGTAMTVVSTTIIPIVGFVIPVVLFWPQIKDDSWCSFHKPASVLLLVIIIGSSILSLVYFFTSLNYSDAQKNDPKIC